MTSQQLLSIAVNGISIGIAYFLAASGLTILFGILRILNFAHGSFLMVGAYLTSLLLRLYGKYGPVEFIAIALVVGVVIGIAGLIVDRVVFRRLHGVDEAVALIATFALMLIVNGGAELVWGANFISVDPPEGLGGGLNIGPVMVPTFSIYLLAIGVLAFILLEVFLHRSWMGKRLLAVAQDRWIMGLLGHSPRKLELWAVFLAFFLAGFAGSVLAPNQVLAPNLGGHFIIQAFAVVIVGGLGSMRGTMLAAMLLGMAEAIGSVFMPSLSLYVCMIVVLILRPQGLIAPRLASAPGPWSLSWLWQGASLRRRPASHVAGEVRSAGLAEQQRHPVVTPRSRSIGAVTAALALALAIIVLPLWIGPGILFIASLLLVSTVFAMSWNLMFGFGGLATFGHAAFFAIGAYLSAFLLKTGTPWPFPIILLTAFALGGAIALAVGIVAIRRSSGVQLAILTLALAEVFRVLVSNSATLGRDEGLSAIPRPTIGAGSLSIDLASDSNYYVFLCIACGLMGWFVWLLSHSAFGRALSSIRQDNQRALFLGLNVDRFRLLSFVAAAAVAAYLGALAAPLTQIVTPDAASVARSTHPMFHTLVGGAGSFWGPAVGAFLFAAIDYSSRTLTGLSEVIMGVTLLVIVLVAPGGAFAYLQSAAKSFLQSDRAQAPAMGKGGAP